MTPLMVLSLDRAMVRPPAGAGLEIVSVPVDGWPPTTVVGLSVRPVSVGAVTPSVADLLMPLRVPVIVAARFAATGRVDTVKVPVVWVAWIVAVPSTVTPLVVLSLDRTMVRPPAGAGLEMVTVPVDGWPPTTVVGLSVRPVTVGAVTPSVADLLMPLRVPVIVAVRFAATGRVDTVKVPVV